ncbi:MAG: hypothetical protein HY724_08025 [Candidatus Rokubacteria bacterium]|nr:hypothetical protein [Candidatus Rokubacteria bacterium]
MKWGKPSIFVGVDADEDSLRGVVVREAMGRATVVAAREWPLPKANTDAERAVALAEALGKLKTLAGSVPGAAWVATLAGSGACLRLIQVPPVPRSELKGAVMWEARTQVPFPLDRALSDHLLLGEVEREGGVRQLLVMLGAAPEEVVLKRLEPFQAAGIRLSGLAPTAAVLWSGRKQLADFPAPEPFAIVHTGDRTTTICVGKGDVLDFTRELALTSGPLVAEEPAKREEHAILRELRRSLDYYQERHGGERIATVVLAGTIGCEPGAAGLLAQLLGCSVKTADPLGRLGLASAKPELAGRSPAFALALAAALAGRGLNLLPPHLRPRAALPLPRLLVPAAALLVLGAAYYHWSLVSAEATYRVLVQRSEAELAQLKGRDEELGRLKGREARLERLSKQMPQVSAEPVPWHDLFRSIAQSLPGNVSLKRLGFTSLEPVERTVEATPMKASVEGVVFGGESEALVALAAVIEGLQSTGSFGTVRVSSPIHKTKEYSKPAAEFGLTFDTRLGSKGKAR